MHGQRFHEKLSSCDSCHLIDMTRARLTARARRVNGVIRLERAVCRSVARCDCVCRVSVSETLLT